MLKAEKSSSCKEGFTLPFFFGRGVRFGFFLRVTQVSQKDLMHYKFFPPSVSPYIIAPLIFTREERQSVWQSVPEVFPGGICTLLYGELIGKPRRCSIQVSNGGLGQ